MMRRRPVSAANPAALPLISRRALLLLSAAAAMPVRSDTSGPAVEPPQGTAAIVRAPSVGQSWQYARIDLLTGKRVSTQVERVIAVGRAVEIQACPTSPDDEPAPLPDWGAAWQKRYLDRESSAGCCAHEVQEPWGMVLVDTHWRPLQAYREPIPLWPRELRPGWSTTVGTYYRIPGSDEIMPWQLTMRALRWESVAVPAGRFTALHFYNIIDFRFTNVSERTAAVRTEHVWLAPQIGRWVLRESLGNFREDVGYEVTEGHDRWELLDWT